MVVSVMVGMKGFLLWFFTQTEHTRFGFKVATATQTPLAATLLELIDLSQIDFSHTLGKSHAPHILKIWLSHIIITTSRPLWILSSIAISSWHLPQKEKFPIRQAKILLEAYEITSASTFACIGLLSQC
jgi:hypothetical protein